jgi:CheY-like chemotaxis protein
MRERPRNGGDMAAGPTSNPPNNATTADAKRSVVLVVDDEARNRALMRAYLSPQHEVREAESGPQALNLCNAGDVDLVVLDVMMPGMSGWEVCRKIRDAVSLAHTGVVMLTGIGDTLNELTSPLYGADAYLDKPFQFTKLQELVEDTLKSRKGGNLGRPERTTGPATRLWKTSISDAPPAEDAPVRTRKAKTAPSAAEKNDVEPAVARLLPGKPPVKAKAAPVAAKASPAKKAPAAKVETAKAPAKTMKKAVTKKAAAKKAPAKAAKAVKKAVTKKAAAKKAPTKKAPIKKVAKKPVKKAAAKKAPSKTAKKTAPAKKKPLKKGR